MGGPRRLRRSQRAGTRVHRTGGQILLHVDHRRSVRTSVKVAVSKRDLHPLKVSEGLRMVAVTYTLDGLKRQSALSMSKDIESNCYGTFFRTVLHVGSATARKL